MYSRNFFKVIGAVIVFLILSQQVPAQLLDRISPRLRSKMNSSSAAEQIRIIVLMQEHRSLSDLQALTAGMSKQDRRQTVVAELKALANASQAALSAYLSGMLSSQKVADIRQLWAINGMAALATAGVIEKIAKFDKVKRIIWDPLVPSAEVQDGAANNISTATAAAISWGVQKINAPAVWDLGYTGQGVLVAILDTGVDYNHPDLENRMWDGTGIFYNGQELINHGYDFGDNDNDPMDVDGHGTNVAGIVAGDGAGGTNQTGVAPEVTIMAIKVVPGIGEETQAMHLDGLQFAIDMGVDIIQMSRSWGIYRDPHYDMWRHQTNMELAAGIIHINSAGNDIPTTPLGPTFRICDPHTLQHQSSCKLPAPLAAPCPKFIPQPRKLRLGCGYCGRHGR